MTTRRKRTGGFNKYGFSGYCCPENGVMCITSTAWCEKYDLTKQEAITLARKKQLRGFRHKGTMWIQDSPPPHP